MSISTDMGPCRLHFQLYFSFKCKYQASTSFFDIHFFFKVHISFSARHAVFQIRFEDLTHHLHPEFQLLPSKI